MTKTWISVDGIKFAEIDGVVYIDRDWVQKSLDEMDLIAKRPIGTITTEEK